MGLLLLLLPLLLVQSEIQQDTEQDRLRVFIVPHSHMDVGWIHKIQADMKTFVDIYSSVINALKASQQRRFIVAEQNFFRLWWDNAMMSEKNEVHKLVAEGRLEFVIGGQVMPDEAVTHMDDQILQLTGPASVQGEILVWAGAKNNVFSWQQLPEFTPVLSDLFSRLTVDCDISFEGHGFLYETFGIQPQFSWQIDSFGASATTSTLFALAGLNAHVISRIDYDLKKNMEKTQNLQFLWRGSQSLPVEQQEIFTHVVDRRSFCTSESQWNESSMFPDFPTLQEILEPEMDLPISPDKVENMAEKLIYDVKQRAYQYQTQNFLWSWGCDRQFVDTLLQFENMDILINYINQRSSMFGVSMEYATLKEYFGILRGLRVNWKVRDHRDFLPYSSGELQAWTGFYASLSGLKALARRASAMLHAAESMFTRHLWSKYSSALNVSWALQQLQQLRWAVSEVQHHNGITGTETPKVRDMYEEHLTEGMENVQEVMVSIVKDKGQVGNDSNVGHMAVIYNPLAWNITTIISFTVDFSDFSVTDHLGNPVPPENLQVQASEKTPSHYDVYVLTTIPGLSYQHFNIRCRNGAQIYIPAPRYFGRKKRTAKGPSDKHLVSVQNDCYTMFLDQDTNLLHSIWEREGNRTVHLTQDFLEYQTNRDTQDPVSDNYVFTPSGAAVSDWEEVTMEIVSGELMTEIRQYFYSEVDEDPTYVIYSRLAHVPPDSNTGLLCHRIEQEVQVGPLEVNTEVILRTSTGLDTQKILYSDNNGYQMQQRNYQMYHYNTIARNYYPMVQTAFIQDNQSRLVVLSDQAHGVSSQGNGQIEIMLHRCLWIENYWMNEVNLTLNDSSVVRPIFWLLLGPLPLTTALRHRSGLELQYRPVVLLRELKEFYFQEALLHQQAVTLPPSLHLQILSIPGWQYSNNHQEHLQMLKEDPMEEKSPNLQRILLRLHHLFEIKEDPVLSQPVTLDLKSVLQGLGKVRKVKERSLTGIWDRNSMPHWIWSTQEKFSERGIPEHTSSPHLSFESSVITVHPKEIRTFFIYF